MPQIFQEETIYLHGYVSARFAKVLATGCPVSMSVAHMDGFVVSKSPFHNSVNYRSAIVFGTGTLIPEEDDAKYEALRIITDTLLKGHWDNSRLPTKAETKGTSVIRLNIESASAKIRTGKCEEMLGSCAVWLFGIHQVATWSFL